LLAVQKVLTKNRILDTGWAPRIWLDLSKTTFNRSLFPAFWPPRCACMGNCGNFVTHVKHIKDH
jgi:hypothetical protein